MLLYESVIPTHLFHDVSVCVWLQMCGSPDCLTSFFLNKCYTLCIAIILNMCVY